MSNNARSDALSVRRERGHSNAYLRSSDLPMTCRRACACVLAASIQQRGWLAKDPIKYANLLGIFGISFDFCTYNTQTRGLGGGRKLLVKIQGEGTLIELREDKANSE